MKLERFSGLAASLYTDQVTAWRTDTVTDEDGLTREREQCVYAALPCHLSKSAGGAPDRPATFPVSEQDYTLFTPREVRFLANDRVEVAHAGERYAGRTERSMVYDLGCETRVHVREVARH